jgi:hypothetical protein
MTKTYLIVAALAAITSTHATAQDSSFQISGSIGSLTNQDGGAGIESYNGIESAATRATAELGFSAAYGFGAGLTGVASLNFGGIDDSVDDDDATLSTSDLTLRVLADRGAYTFGGFLGFGTHEDNGDSDEDMTYQYLGAEVAGDTSFGGYFVQVGYLDSADEYDEGTQDAPFVNVGGSYDITSDYSLTGSFGYAGGKKFGADGDDNRTLNASIGVERSVGNILVTAGYEFTQISFEDSDGDRFGDTFGEFTIGATYAFGGEANHGTLLPSFGNWVAFNANEIE